MNGSLGVCCAVKHSSAFGVAYVGGAIVNKTYRPGLHVLANIGRGRPASHLAEVPRAAELQILCETHGRFKNLGI